MTKSSSAIVCKKTKDGQLNLTLEDLSLTITKEGKETVVYSPDLELCASGKTLEEAKTHFREVVELFFEELTSEGTLEAALTELGWKKEKKQWKSPVQVDIRQTIVIPSQTMRTAS